MKTCTAILTSFMLITGVALGRKPALNDFDGDGRSDLVVYDAAGNYGQLPGSWYFMLSSNGFRRATSGYRGTVPIFGDFDGDGLCDYGVYDAVGRYRQPPGSWYFMTSSNGFAEKTFGFPGTIPVTGDFDSDGIDDYGCNAPVDYYCSNSGWYFMLSRDGFATCNSNSYYYGGIPVVGDFNGDGVNDYASYFYYGIALIPAPISGSPQEYYSYGAWRFITNKNSSTEMSFGYFNTVPFAGDFDDDGISDYGVYDAVGLYGQPPGSWYFMMSSNGFVTKVFGYAGTVPILGDFDGDGVDDYGCYDAVGCYGQTPGSWFIMQSTDGFRKETFGYAGTVPAGTQVMSLEDTIKDVQERFRLDFLPVVAGTDRIYIWKYRGGSSPWVKIARYTAHRSIAAIIQSITTAEPMPNMLDLSSCEKMYKIDFYRGADQILSLPVLHYYQILRLSQFTYGTQKYYVDGGIPFLK